MKLSSLVLSVFFFNIMVYNASSQNLHTHSNAASLTNEANATTGWTGAATLTSVTTPGPQNGNFSIRVTSTSNSGRDTRYTFTAVVNTVYNISIWARRGATFNNPAFANWTGVSGFATTLISSQTWTQYNFTVTATNTSPVIVAYAAPIGAAAGNEILIDAVSIVAQGGGGDTQAPTAPTNLTANNITATTTTLSWTASNDNVGVTQYQIRRDNVMVGSVAGNITTYNATGLTSSTTYSFNVVAVDAANNVSNASNTVQVTTQSGGGGDNQPPSAPSNLSASNIGSTTLTLSWTASNDNVGVTNYNIFRNNAFFGQTGNAGTTYNATGLTASTTYSFYIVAQDAAGNSSNQSNSINVTTTSGGGGGTAYTTENANLPTVNWQSLNFYSSGNVGIGTAATNNFRLAVNGNMRAKEVIVESGWSDYVFDENYDLPSLNDVEKFIEEYGHLKDIPSASEVEKNGVGLAEINTRLLQKIEEMTLYLIDINKRIKVIEEMQSE